MVRYFVFTFYVLEGFTRQGVSRDESLNGKIDQAMGVSRKTVNELCTGKRTVTVDTALLLAKVFGNTPDFWLNLQRRIDIWTIMHTSKRKARIEKAKPLREAFI
jgi:addiction module HigA family antidote